MHLVSVLSLKKIHIFQRGRQTRSKTPTYYLTNFSQKLHENEIFLARLGGGGGGAHH